LGHGDADTSGIRLATATAGLPIAEDLAAPKKPGKAKKPPAKQGKLFQ